MSVLLLFLLMGAGFVWVVVPALATYLAAAFALIVLGMMWFVYWYPRRAYRAWGYRMDAKVLETCNGVIFRVTQLLPLPRLQHVDLRRGPLERLYGLASLVLYTAGTQANSITIPGLDADEAVRLRNKLVEVGGDDAV